MAGTTCCSNLAESRPLPACSSAPRASAGAVPSTRASDTTGRILRSTMGEGICSIWAGSLRKKVSFSAVSLMLSDSRKRMVSMSLFCRKGHWSMSLAGLRRRAGWLCRRPLYSFSRAAGTGSTLRRSSVRARGAPLKSSWHRHPRPQESTAHGGPALTAAQSALRASSGLYCSPTCHPHFTRPSGLDAPAASCSDSRSNAASFQSSVSVTTTADTHTHPWTSLQSLVRNATAVATCRSPHATYSSSAWPSSFSSASFALRGVTASVAM
mmetsp:Transcript_2014/g.7050  ORF Transcript_2014/g.7050 Transcript_2014/m.7050 type:complete len:268 (-) Transcript_2014:480-1283(-)